MHYMRDENDIDEPLSVQFVKEKIENESRYLLFKVVFNSEGTKKSHLGICGPFNINADDIVINQDDEYEQVFYDENFDPLRIDDLFKIYLENASPSQGLKK